MQFISHLYLSPIFFHINTDKIRLTLLYIWYMCYVAGNLICTLQLFSCMVWVHGHIFAPLLYALWHWCYSPHLCFKEL